VYKPNDAHPDRAKQRGRRLAAITGLALVAATGMLLQLPLGAAAGIASGDDGRILSRDPPAAAAAAAAPNQKASGTYQLRCWQYGRLLFDEGPVTLGAEARQGAKLVAIDRHGAPLIITDAGGTTCLARPSAAAPNLALPRWGQRLQDSGSPP
jgi:hypothetical protein